MPASKDDRMPSQQTKTRVAYYCLKQSGAIMGRKCHAMKISTLVEFEELITEMSVATTIGFLSKEPMKHS